MLKIIRYTFLTTLITSSLMYYADSLISKYVERVHYFKIYFPIIFIILLITLALTKPMLVNNNLKLEFIWILLVIFIFIYFGKLQNFNIQYFLNRIDYEAHFFLQKNVSYLPQQFLQTTYLSSNKIYNDPFYPTGIFYFINFLDVVTNYNYSIKIMQYCYILYILILWPATIYSLISLYVKKNKIRIIISFFSLSFTNFPFEYIRWGHLPTLFSILFAINLFILLNEIKCSTKNRNILKVIALIIIFPIHPIGIGTFILIEMMNTFYKYNNIKAYYKYLKNLLILLPTTIILVTTIPSVRYNLQQNFEKLFKDFNFIYEDSFLTRATNFYIKWFVSGNIENQNIWILVNNLAILFICVYLSKNRMKSLILLSSYLALLTTTAFSQIDNILNVLSLVTLIFYSSPQRFFHVFIIIFIFMMILLRENFLIKYSNYILFYSLIYLIYVVSLIRVDKLL